MMKKKLIPILMFLSLINAPYSLAQKINDNEKIPIEYIAKLDNILGYWQTNHYEYASDNTWTLIATSTTEFTKVLKGKLIVEKVKNMHPANGFIVETYISYDQYRNLYRLAAIDDIYGLMDIYEGKLENKTLQVTNLRAGTYFPSGENGKMHFRLSFTETTKNNREFLVERSDNEGTSWIPMNKSILVRNQ
jgi:hypothetical protein